ncbi:MAG TPA: Holliday junction branch migration protein RuvA [Geopsychrobacteraceae bacterium]|nr:Holliday junction branch migration protein RuvA [Geopsychrobacteraceae bacterium]
MIALLTGQIAYRSADHIILDVGGVGYRLQIPLSTFYALPEEGQVQLKVHTHVKEDAFHLFGFLSDAEKSFFALLISVSGVGPKLAITVLSHIPTNELGLALAEGDVTRLTAIPGIGKKSAERLILELQDKAANLITGLPALNKESLSVIGDNSLNDAVSALVNLGYKESLAKKALKGIEIQPNTTLEEILKGALKILVK